MKYHFVDLITYSRRFETGFINEVAELYPDYFIIPKGGSNDLAIPGLA